jgi:hypothetical protein
MGRRALETEPWFTITGWFNSAECPVWELFHALSLGLVFLVAHISFVFFYLF